jgi:hypothetical protein
MRLVENSADWVDLCKDRPAREEDCEAVEDPNWEVERPLPAKLRTEAIVLLICDNKKFSYPRK